MNKKRVMTFGMVAVSAFMLWGCGNTAEETTQTEETQEVSEITTEKDEETDESSINPPVLADYESYDAIISTLEPGQAYAFADMDPDNDVLLVASGCFDNCDEEGNMAAIDAEIYGFDKDGNIIDYGHVESDGTAYPLSIYEGCLIYGGNHHVGLSYIDESISSLITKEDAEEIFDENGNATYYYLNSEEEFEGEVDDDSKLTALFDKYAEAIVINFTAVQ